MTNSEKLEKLSQDLLDIKIRMTSIFVQIQTSDRDIATLHMVKANLKENISFLKKKFVIVSATEYIKIKSDMKTLETRLSFLTKDKSRNQSIYEYLEKLFGQTQKEYEEILELIHNPPNNVISVNFKKIVPIKG